MAVPTGIPADDIDGLLQRYLGLLEDYTKLRASLTALQAIIYQDIARANFSAERGVRYGQDLYDERMQRSRDLNIIRGENGTPIFEVTAQETRGNDSQEDMKHEANEADVDDEAEKEEEKPRKSNDPLRWFGILTPMPLRQAQSRSIEAVEQIIPRLVSVDAEMADVEIRVRRARKRRAKAEAAAVKQLAGDVEKVTLEEKSAAPAHNMPEPTTEKTTPT